MKTDEEIKKFIDSKNVLTQKELGNFIYGHRKGNGKLSGRWLEWWQYVLDTKDWKELREYRDNLITKHHKNRFETFREIYKKDKRISGFGIRKQLKILETIYGLHYSNSTLSKYNNLLCSQQKD